MQRRKIVLYLCFCDSNRETRTRGEKFSYSLYYSILTSLHLGFLKISVFISVLLNIITGSLLYVTHVYNGF